MSVTRGQLPPSGEADRASAGRLSGEKTSSVPSKDPRVDTVEARTASDGRGSPEGEPRGQRSGVG